MQTFHEKTILVEVFSKVYKKMSKHYKLMQAIQKQDLKALKAKRSDEEISEKSLEAKLVERQSKVMIMFTKHIPQNLLTSTFSLTCSSRGCECNWSTFEHFCWKNKSKLEYKKVEDLVNIKYNQALKQRFDTCDVIDFILLDDIDGMGESRREGEDPEDDLVYDYNNLTGRGVANFPIAEQLEIDEVQEEEIYSRNNSENDKEDDLYLEDND
ncbi:hypothetical protein CR513_12767, partial [Mucuna pruriens]